MGSELNKKILDKHFKLQLDSYFTGNRISKVSKNFLNDPTYHKNLYSNRIMQEIIKDWVKEGWIEELKNFNNADSDDICIKLLKYSDGTDVSRNWYID